MRAGRGTPAPVASPPLGPRGWRQQLVGLGQGRKAEWRRTGISKIKVKRQAVPAAAVAAQRILLLSTLRILGLCGLSIGFLSNHFQCFLADGSCRLR